MENTVQIKLGLGIGLKLLSALMAEGKNAHLKGVSEILSRDLIEDCRWEQPSDSSRETALKKGEPGYICMVNLFFFLGKTCS